MPNMQEKIEFSARLKHALEKAEFSVTGATDLARLFNRQHVMSGIGISVQTAYKWLNGGAIPTPEKIKVLATWLSVSEHWLHYGPAPESTVLTTNYSFLSQTEKLIQKTEVLPEHQRYWVEELIEYFLKK